MVPRDRAPSHASDPDEATEEASSNAPYTCSDCPADPAEREPLMTAIKVANEIGVCVRTLRRYVAAGKLTVIKFGRTVRFDRADVDTFIEASRGSK